MRPRLAFGIVLIALIAGCSSAGSSQSPGKSDPCAKASVLQQQVASKEKAAQVALDLATAYAGHGETVKANQTGDRYVDLQRQLGEDNKQLKALQAECLNG